MYSILISIVIGFYDGFIGPGGRQFSCTCIYYAHGFRFFKSKCKCQNGKSCHQLGSIIFFVGSGRIIYSIAIPMAISNAAGGAIGARVAIAKGNNFIRVFFLLVVTGTIIRFAYDVFFRDNLNHYLCKFVHSGILMEVIFNT